MTKIITCTCSHTHQDAMHGTGRRAHNLCTGKSEKNGINVWRCTVCGAERASGHRP